MTGRCPFNYWDETGRFGGRDYGTPAGRCSIFFINSRLRVALSGTQGVIAKAPRTSRDFPICHAGEFIG